MESLEYLLNYDVRVSGIILKIDLDNKERRILTVKESPSSLYALPGGKLPVKCMNITKLVLNSFIINNKERLHSKFEDEKDKFTEKEIMQKIDNEELRNGLELELYEELGLTTKKEQETYIENIKPYAIYIEKQYSIKGIFISPIYIVEIAKPDIFTLQLEERKKKGFINDYKLCSPLEITSPSYHDTFEYSVNNIYEKLKEDNLLNGKKKKRDTIKFLI